MQFIKNGPDIPERLLQLHEDGKVVFFCGAGISYPARLPGYGGLVEQLYEALQLSPNVVQQMAINSKQYDTAIALLEADVGRTTVRRKLVEILDPDLTASNATTTHKALLTLSKNNENKFRLITTNFDRLFEYAIAEETIQIERFEAPLLPIPKERLDGLIYLHGLIPESPTDNQLERLVASSGDFGLAYLTERWAARFVSELFRKYTVCFVGYSLNDPILRYMTDALAADRLLGESTLEMFAFSSYSKGNEVKAALEWEAKSVTPILYREFRRHHYLHKTLAIWADIYRDGLHGKGQIVVQYASLTPSVNTKEDDFVSRMVWALSDSSRHPAKLFAEHDPVPSLDWLEPLFENNIRIDDLIPWLVRHLGDPKLVLWLAERGGKLKNDFIHEIEQRPEYFDRLIKENDVNEITNILKNAPKAVPDEYMQIIWYLFITGRVITNFEKVNIYNMFNHYKIYGLTTSVRMEFIKALTPYVSISKKIPYEWYFKEEDDSKPYIIDVKCNVELASKHISSCIIQLYEDSHFSKALPEMLQDFTCLLQKVLDLKHELGVADKENDGTYYDVLCIKEYSYNITHDEWTVLIGLTRDAWLAVKEKSPEQAQLVAKSWWQIPYPLFRRMCFFAATFDEVIPHTLAINWLLSDNHRWLWSIETQREVIQLLVALGPKIDAKKLMKIENAILKGPPTENLLDDTGAEGYCRYTDKKIWLRLAKCEAAGAKLTERARIYLQEVYYKHPEWHLEDDQRDEFPDSRGEFTATWCDDVSTIDDSQNDYNVPNTLNELIDWLRKYPDGIEGEYDGWQKYCERNQDVACCALIELANQEFWPEKRWEIALVVWTTEDFAIKSWKLLSPILINLPEHILRELATTLSRWLKVVAKNIEVDEKQFFKLAQNILSINFEFHFQIDDPLNQAINHPVGIITEALINVLSRKSSENLEGLPAEIKNIFTMLCDANNTQYRDGRVILAFQIVSLLRIDKEWSKQHLLPLFDWQKSRIEAKVAWSGYLHSARPYRPLMELLHSQFLDVAQNYGELGENGQSYASLLTYTVLNLDDIFISRNLTTAIDALPPEGLVHVANKLIQTLNGSRDKRHELWNNRIRVFLDKFWPKSKTKQTADTAEALGRLCIATGDQFPDALDFIREWLQPVSYPGPIFSQLHESNLCAEYPEQTLEFLHKINDERNRWPTENFGNCLRSIIQAKHDLRSDNRFQHLEKYAYTHGVVINP